jgi:hypothetical protein
MITIAAADSSDRARRRFTAAVTSYLLLDVARAELTTSKRSVRCQTACFLTGEREAS